MSVSLQGMLSASFFLILKTLYNTDMFLLSYFFEGHALTGGISLKGWLMSMYFEDINFIRLLVLPYFCNVIFNGTF